MKELQDLIDEIMDFQVKTFPTSNAISKLHHLGREIPELIEELEGDDTAKIEDEYADHFLLLFGSAAIHGLTADDIARICRTKLEKNRLRKWGTPDAQGVVHHIKD